MMKDVLEKDKIMYSFYGSYCKRSIYVYIYLNICKIYLCKLYKEVIDIGVDSKMGILMYELSYVIVSIDDKVYGFN